MILSSNPVSIVIPSYNRAKFLPSLIKNLLELNYKDYEIIIVDDGSIDRTKEILKDFPIKVISINKSIGSAEARNIGIQHARYDLIAVTDSDCYVSKNWLRDLVPYLNEYDMVGGKIVYSDKAEAKLNPSIKDIELICLDSPVNFLNTSNMIFRKEVWKELDGFSSYRLEDVDYSWRALKKGLKLIYVPKGLVIHYGRRSIFKNIKKYFQYGKSYSIISFIQKMSFSYKSEPIFTPKLLSGFIKIILFSLTGLFSSLVLNFFIQSILTIPLFMIAFIPSLAIISFLILKEVFILYILFKITIF
ncbi:MAG: glycosyltransferase, partial [Candidatus Lokiarchaeota archaeon]